MARGALVVIGSGPGIGLHVASKFAASGFNRIFLLSRNANRLEDDRRTVISASGRSDIHIQNIVADISSQESLANAFQEIEQTGVPVEVVFFNAARVETSEMPNFPIEEVDVDIKVSLLALYQTSQWAVPLFRASKGTLNKPALLVTNSLLYKYPEPTLFSLTFTKAGQRSLVQTMNMTYAPEDIHVGLISVGGIVAPEKKQLNPTNIANKTWDFYESGKAGDLEVEIVEA